MRIDADCRTFLRTVARNYENEALHEAFEKCESVGAAVLAFTETTMVDAKPEFVEGRNPIATFAMNLELFVVDILPILSDYSASVVDTMLCASLIGDVARCADESIKCGDSNVYDTDMQEQMRGAMALITEPAMGYLDLERSAAILFLAENTSLEKCLSLYGKKAEFRGGTTMFQTMALSMFSGLDRDEVELMSDEQLKARLAKRNQSTPAT